MTQEKSNRERARDLVVPWENFNINAWEADMGSLARGDLIRRVSDALTEAEARGRKQERAEFNAHEKSLLAARVRLAELELKLAKAVEALRLCRDQITVLDSPCYPIYDPRPASIAAVVAANKILFGDETAAIKEIGGDGK